MKLGATCIAIVGAGVEGTVHTSGRKRQVRFGSQSFASDILSERQQQSLAATCEQQGASKVVSILVQKDSDNHASNGASSNGSNGVSRSVMHASHAATVGVDQSQHQSSSHVAEDAGTSSHTEEDSNVWVFTFEDTMHQGSAAAVQELQKGSWHHNNSSHKKLRLMMLTGDNEDSAQRVARQLNIADVKAGLSPEQKLQVMPRTTSHNVKQQHVLQ